MPCTLNESIEFGAQKRRIHRRNIRWWRPYNRHGELLGIRIFSVALLICYQLRANSACQVVALDWDVTAIKSDAAQSIVREFGTSRFRAVHSKFSDIEHVLRDIGFVICRSFSLSFPFVFSLHNNCAA